MKELVDPVEFAEHWERGRAMSYAAATALPSNPQPRSATEMTPRSGKLFVAGEVT